MMCCTRRYCGGQAGLLSPSGAPQLLRVMIGGGAGVAPAGGEATPGTPTGWTAGAVPPLIKLRVTPVTCGGGALAGAVSETRTCAQRAAGPPCGTESRL